MGRQAPLALNILSDVYLWKSMVLSGQEIMLSKGMYVN